MSQRMQKTLKLLLKYGFLYCVGGSIYYGIEILWRGFSHWTMFCLAGMCFIFAGLLNEIESWETPFWRQVLQAWALGLHRTSIQSVGADLLAICAALVSAGSHRDYSG